jgi:hypothetical protein
MTTEVVYTWPDGREEVRYRRAYGSKEAFYYIEQVNRLRRMHGEECPYSIRHVNPDITVRGDDRMARTHDEEYDNGVDYNCTHCGGEGMQEADNPLWDASDEVPCKSCNGTGLRKHQTIF